MCLAVPGQIVTITGDDPLTRSAHVSFGGVMKDVCMAYVPDALVGDFVLVHVGVALQTIDQDEAQQVFKYLREMGELAELEEAAA